MRTADLITQKLTRLSRRKAQGRDESFKHEAMPDRGRAGKLITESISCRRPSSKTRLERHRMINQALSAELAGGIHALALHASAPGEPTFDIPLIPRKWESSTGPACAGRADYGLAAYPPSPVPCSG